MTIFDLLFIVLLFAGIVTLIAGVAYALAGKRRLALAILRNLALCAAGYVGIVYLVTALSRELVYGLRTPVCNDDWCVAVEDVKRTPKDLKADFEVTLRISSRARRRAQRENIATDVYLVDAHWNRYDPILDGSEVPLNTLLQPLESVTTRRRFELPNDAQEIGLKIGHQELPICLIIGECEAFHKGAIIRM